MKRSTLITTITDQFPGADDDQIRQHLANAESVLCAIQTAMEIDEPKATRSIAEIAAVRLGIPSFEDDEDWDEE